MSEYHVPVMRDLCIEGLNINPDGVYVDVTFGGGGHSRAILDKLSPKGQLYAFDQDSDAARNLIEHPSFNFIPQNFEHLIDFLRLEGVRNVDGVLADLGVSSFQFDTAQRGFSYRFDAALDMRMNQNDSLTAEEVVNTYDAMALQIMFSNFGEIRNSRTLAARIVEARKQKRIQTINHLINVVEPVVKLDRQRYLAQVFQSIRIEVNRELDVLDKFLEDSYKILNPKGRVVVLTYHSLEDKRVKNYFKYGNVKGQQIKDEYGHIFRPYKLINKKPIVASPDEMTLNSRSKSAKLRIVEKL